MKKWFALCLSFVLMLGFSSCSNQPSDSSDTSNIEPVSEIVFDNTENAEPGSTVPSTVYMTTDISPEGLMAVYEALNWAPEGKVAVKLSTGEPPNSNYLRPELIANVVQAVDGTIVECNTA